MNENGMSFLYNAYAVGFGGYIQKPFQEVLDAQASVALPVTGGYASAEAENYNYRQLISFRHASTQITGGEMEPGKNVVHITTTIEGLNILGVISAERITGTLSVEYSGGESRIVPLGSEFVGLSIAGKPVSLDLHVSTFTQHDTMAKLEEAYCNNETFRKELEKDFLWTREAALEVNENIPDYVRQTREWAWNQPYNAQQSALPKASGYVPVSLIKKIHCDDKTLEPFANSVHIPQTGVVYLGELRISEKQRRLTMIRVELGSSHVGRVSGGDAGGNGSDGP